MNILIHTKNTAIIDEIGMIAQINATRRHDKNDPKKKTMKIPDADAIPLQAIKIPRIDGSLFILTKKIIQKKKS